jgi:hypothetical protein
MEKIFTVPEILFPVAASAVVSVRLHDFKFFTPGVLSQQPKLVLSVLPPVFQRYSGVNRSPDSHTYRIRRASRIQLCFAVTIDRF